MRLCHKNACLKSPAQWHNQYNVEVAKSEGFQCPDLPSLPPPKKTATKWHLVREINFFRDEPHNWLFNTKSFSLKPYTNSKNWLRRLYVCICAYVGLWVCVCCSYIDIHAFIPTKYMHTYILIFLNKKRPQIRGSICIFCTWVQCHQRSGNTVRLCKLKFTGARSWTLVLW